MATLKGFLLAVFQKAKEDNIDERSASLAYYMIFALVPFLLLLLSILGIIFSKDVIRGWIASYFNGKVEGAAVFFTNLFHGISNLQVTTVASIVGFVFVVYAASTLFVHLRRTFCVIFKLSNSQGSFFRKKIQESTHAFFYMGVFFVLIFLLVIWNISSSLFFGEVQGISGTFVPTFFFAIGKSAITFLISIFVFEVIYRFASERSISWGASARGGVVAALFFFLVNIALSIYLSLSNNLSAYGTIGFFIAFLLWFYFTSLALFLGAEVACLYEQLHTKPGVRKFFSRILKRNQKNKDMLQ